MPSCKQLQKQANANENRCAVSTPSVGTRQIKKLHNEDLIWLQERTTAKE